MVSTYGGIKIATAVFQRQLVLVIMPSNAEDRSDLIEVIPATSEQEPILANLLALYVHDFSEFHEIDLQADGRFGYPDLLLA